MAYFLEIHFSFQKIIVGGTTCVPGGTDPDPLSDLYTKLIFVYVSFFMFMRSEIEDQDLLFLGGVQITLLGSCFGLHSLALSLYLCRYMYIIFIIYI